MEDINKALAEVSDIILHFNYNIIKKIPIKFINFIEENKDQNYIANIDYSISINEQKLLPETREILAIIYRDYLADEKERQEIINKSKQYEKALREKYNSENLLKKEEKENTNNIKNEDRKLEVYKESIFSKFIKFMKKLIKL